MPTHSLFALLVAIDRYPASLPSLRGCVNDMRAFRDYLARQCDNEAFGFKPLVLENEAATRDAVIEGFQHFNHAKERDVCVLFFAGHGSRIPAPQFWEASDGLNECILCADSTRDDASKDIVDKELSWLIHQAAGKKNIHFLAVMDCCHSGTNTRDGDLPIGIRQVQNRRAPRPLEDYEGHRNYPRDANGLYSAPKSPHIAFGACRSYQTAKEISLGGTVRGAFTTSLIEALESAHTPLSYADLESRVAQKIANRTFDQLPQLDPVAGADPKKDFLGGAVAPQRRFSVSWNARAHRWELDAGLIDGISAAPQPAKVALKQPARSLRVIEASATASHVEGMEGLDTALQYEAIVQKTGISARQVAPAPGSDAGLQAVLEKSFAEASPLFAALAPDPEQAEFWAHSHGDKYALTYRGSDRPVFNPVDASGGEAAAKDFWQKTNAVFQWQHLFHLENPQPGTIGDDEFELELWRSEGRDWRAFETYEPVADWQNPPPFCWKQSLGNLVAPGYALRLRNTGKRDLHFAALHLIGRYGVDNQYLPGQKLAPGQETWLTWTDKNGKTQKGIGLNIEEKHWKAGFTDMTDYVKILVSTVGIPTSRFNQPGLDLTETLRPRDITRDGMTDDDGMDQPGWTTRRIPLRIIKPQRTQSWIGGIVSLFNNLRLSAPAGFSATTGLAGEAEAARGFEAPPAPINCPGFRPLSLTPGFGRSAGASVLELTDIQGADAISPETPLEIALEDASLLEEGEVVLPFGYDPDTGAWYPLGLPGDAHTPMRVGTLPAPLPAGDRAIGESLLMFFHKISLGKPVVGAVATWLMGDLKPFRLAAVQVDGEENLIPVATGETSIGDLVTKASRILLYTHGITGDTRDSVKLVRRLRDPNDAGRCLQDCYDLVLTFDYENLGTDIDQIARELGKALAAVGLGPGHGKTLHLVAHSMGGLVARWFIERENGYQVVSALVQAGTPNGGTKLHRAYDFGQFLLTEAVNYLPVPEVVWDITGWLARQSGVAEVDKTFVMMKPGSGFLTDLAASPDPGIPYFVVAGNTRLTGKRKTVLGKILQRLGYGTFDLLFGEPNDLAVAVADIHRLPAERRFPAVPQIAACNHLTYFNSAEGLEALGKVLWQLQK